MPLPIMEIKLAIKISRSPRCRKISFMTARLSHFCIRSRDLAEAQEVAAGIKSHATPEAQQGLQIVTAKLKDHAVTTGAAKLAVDNP